MTAAGTWHYGLVARWWAEFNVAEPHELAFFRAAIERFGEPVLDLGCGTGRILLPLLEEGFDVDGSDVSADMIAGARALAARRALKPRLAVQPMHQLKANRRYRTVYICGALGIGGRRDHDRETLMRVHDALEPGGALLITDHEPFRSRPVRPDWPASGERRKTIDGDEIELIGRLAAVDEAAECLTREIRARLWRDGQLVTEESGRLTEIGYSANELERMLRDSGFINITVCGNYTDQPATPDDKMLTVTAARAES